MSATTEVYSRLQKHLNSQVVGFPSTRSGVELKVLKHIFTEQEAEIALCLSYKFEPLETIFAKACNLVDTTENLEKALDDIQKKGGIESKIKDGKRLYCNAPLIVGMYEMQLGRLTPDFIKDFGEYTKNKKFGIEFLSTELPQMRTIPVSRSIEVQHNVSTFDEITSLLQQADEPFVIIECICRKKKALEDKPCSLTERKETCLAIGGVAQSVLLSGLGRKISKQEALSIIEKNQQDGLVLQPSNAEKAEFICSCCGCCCGMLNIHKKLPAPLNFWASNYYALVNLEDCVGCGICEQRCQVAAVTVSDKKYAAVNLNRCLGCGLCVSTCPNEAITLQKKETEIKPPATREELHEIIMANKKGKWEKVKLTGKLIVDSIRTGTITFSK
jgi:formate hydrogenlyase subunit 6/NADH:ubiquinone oxidoreductase subunit I